MSAFDAPVCLWGALSVCLLSSWCYREYTPTQMEGQVLQGLVCTGHLITDLFKKCLFTQLPLFLDNKHCNMLCVHCIVKFIKVKIWGGGDDYLKLCCWEIKWYTFYLDCIVYIYLIQKNKFIEFSRHVLLVNPKISDETNT